MRNSKLPVTVQRWADANPDMVFMIHTEDDGFSEYGDWSIWCYFTPGWINTLDEVHMIHEARACDFFERVKFIKPCDCPGCTFESDEVTP